LFLHRDGGLPRKGRIIQAKFRAMLSAHGIACVRGERRLFADLDLEICPGEWVHVRGENGTGKTSLLRILVGLSQPAAGEVRWQGEAIHDCRGSFHGDTLFLGHHGAVKEELTALENLQFDAALDGGRLDERACLAVLHQFGLLGRESFPVRYLSAGQKRRVLLSRLLTRRAKLWVLDEPFTALDTRAVAALTKLIADHTAAGGMAVLTSHQDIPLDGGRTITL
jgi:heme exporter protein A